MKEERDSAMVLESLSAREQDILWLLAKGQTNREIAHELGLELKPVKWYNTQIFDKLGVRSRYKAVLQAQRSDVQTNPGR